MQHKTKRLTPTEIQKLVELTEEGEIRWNWRRDRSLHGRFRSQDIALSLQEGVPPGEGYYVREEECLGGREGYLMFCIGGAWTIATTQDLEGLFKAATLSASQRERRDLAFLRVHLS